MKKLSSFLIVLSVFTARIGYTASLPDTVRIPLGGTVQVEWTAPPDTDVVRYRLILNGVSADYVERVEIGEWYTSEQNEMYVWEQRLAVGVGFAYMTAVDRVGNESLPSQSVYYEIYDDRPGPPNLTRLKVIP